MIYVNPKDVSVALGLSLEKVIDAVIALLDTPKFREHVAFDESYSLRDMSLGWRAICMIRNHLQRGEPSSKKRELDEKTIGLIKMNWPAAPVEVRNPCKGCSKEKPSQILRIRKPS